MKRSRTRYRKDSTSIIMDDENPSKRRKQSRNKSLPKTRRRKQRHRLPPISQDDIDNARSTCHRHHIYGLCTHSMTQSYVGWTTNPLRRLKQHRRLIKGGAKKTAKFKGDCEYLVIVSGGFLCLRDAQHFEAAWGITRKKFQPKLLPPKTAAGAVPQLDIVASPLNIAAIAPQVDDTRDDELGIVLESKRVRHEKVIKSDRKISTTKTMSRDDDDDDDDVHDDDINNRQSELKTPRPSTDKEIDTTSSSDDDECDDVGKRFVDEDIVDEHQESKINGSLLRWSQKPPLKIPSKLKHGLIDRLFKVFQAHKWTNDAVPHDHHWRKDKVFIVTWLIDIRQYGIDPNTFSSVVPVIHQFVGG